LAYLLSWYRQLIVLKKSHPAFFGDDNIMLDEQNPQVLSWMRKPRAERHTILSPGELNQQSRGYKRPG